MGRRSDHTRIELKELLLKAARDVVATDGIQALTARRLAQEIGYSVGTIYNVFADLQELIWYLNGETLDLLAEELKHAKTLTGLSKRYIAFVQQELPRWQLLTEPPTERKLPAWYQAKVDRAIGILEEKVAIERGGSPANVRRVSRVLWAGLHGICALDLAGKLRATRSESAAILADTLVDALIETF